MYGVFVALINYQNFSDQDNKENISLQQHHLKFLQPIQLHRSTAIKDSQVLLQKDNYNYGMIGVE